MFRTTNVKNLITPGTIMNTTLNSAPQQLYDTFFGTIQAVWAGIPNGTFKLQASADEIYTGNAVFSAPVNWTDITGSSVTVMASGNFMWNLTEPGYNWVRVVYTDASGGASTATISSLTFNGKGL